MAKAEIVKAMEKHVEKLVLAACAIALVLGVWRWGASSPTQIEVVRTSGAGNAPVAPTEVDAVLVKAADNVRQMYLDSDLANTIPPVPAWVSHLENIRQVPPLPIPGTQLALPAQPIAPVEPPEGQPAVTLDRLVKLMPVPAAPVVSASIELPRREPPVDIAQARGVGSYPLDQLAAAWQQELPTVPIQAVVPYKVIVEAQQMPADGNWDKATTVKVEVPAQLDESGKPVVPEIPDFDGTNIKEVREARDAVFAARDRILQQQALPVWNAQARQWVAPVAPQAGANDIVFYDDSKIKIGGPSWRYRVQLVVVNPVLTYGDAVRLQDPADAQRRFLTSQPSPWSAPVSVRPDVYFFLTGSNPFARKMTVDVYVRHWGQLVKERFDVQVGEFIGGKKDVELTDPTQNVRRLVEVNFSTGCIVIGLDFRKKLPRVGLMAKETPEVLYVDPDGNIRRRIKAWDDVNEKKKQLEDVLRNR